MEETRNDHQAQAQHHHDRSAADGLRFAVAAEAPVVSSQRTLAAKTAAVTIAGTNSAGEVAGQIYGLAR